MHFSLTVIGCCGSWSNEIQKEMATVNAISKFLVPLRAGTDPFVIPEIKPLILQPLDFGEYHITVFVGVAYEDVGIITAIGWEGLVHAFFLIVLGEFILTEDQDHSKHTVAGVIHVQESKKSACGTEQPPTGLVKNFVCDTKSL
jgi:hypothetical protein|tara:strand:- start:697 stop:1128 length:432 start_codon:yes stop_codon:yes gene_type:complete